MANQSSNKRPIAQSGNEVSNLLARAIKCHLAAYAYFESATYLSDSMVIGREPTAEDKAHYDAASDAESVALTAVCAFPAIRPVDLAAKGAHLLKFHGWQYASMTEEHFRVLLETMAAANGGRAA